MQGRAADAKHTIKGVEMVPAELKKLKVGMRVVIFSNDGYNRSVVFAEGAWYVANYSLVTAWSHIGYTAAHYDFNCCFLGTMAELVEALQQLLKGQEVVVNSRKKSQAAATQFVRYKVSDPHRKEVVAAPKPDQGNKSKNSDTKRSPAELVAALKDKALSSRVDAALDLGKLGPSAKDAVPALIAVLAEDKDPFARRAAAVALGQIGPAAREAVPRLVAILVTQAEYATLVPLEAGVALAKVDPEGTASVPLLTAKLKDPADYVRLYAAISLGGQGSAARAGAPALIDALKKDKWNDVRSAAAAALPALRAEAEVVVPALMAALADENPFVRRAAIRALGTLGPAAKPALAGIQKTLKDSDAEVRQAAEEVLLILQGK